ncbi:hydrogen peroxide-inducible genes activator [Rhodoferax sp. OV413]|uniref:hydrogen peroxide-inducible genes activator n=1 Tax=Rhodoferax sp. OV413 TaxID=1855285 RepID=UPI0025F44ED1|nr:hydrogen peroxide-inducible genes activator [Rhodoferax sp. OV413]
MSTLPSLKQLRYLLALAEHLNFTRAAQASFVSQSTLSTGLKELESTLGVQLVERDKQTVSFTPIGAEVVARARQVLASAEDLSDFVADAARPMQKQLRLGVIPTIAPFVLPNLMPLLRVKFPQLQLAMREDLTANLMARLHSRQLDFALIALPYQTEDLRVLKLYEDKFWLVELENDSSSSGKAIQISSQWTERLILLEEGHCLRDHSLQACSATEVAGVKGIEVTSLLTLVQMVSSGLGVALLPELAIQSGLLNGSSLQARPLAPPAPVRTIALVTRPTSAHMAEFEAIADLIAAASRQD